MTMWMTVRSKVLQRFGFAPRLPPAPACGLGIVGLPASVAQLPNAEVTALLLPGTLGQVVWLGAMLESALRGGPVFLLAENQERVDNLLQQEPLHRAYTQRQLTVFVLRQDGPERIARNGVRPLLAELERVGLRRTRALFVLGANRWLLEGNQAMTQAGLSDLQAWCKRQRGPVVFGFDTADCAAELQRLDDAMFQHLARLDLVGTRPLLEIWRWRNASALALPAHYYLWHDQRRGQLRCSTNRTAPPAAAAESCDVVATAAAVAAQKGVPQHWKLVAGLGEVEAALRDNTAATILLLHISQISEFEALARLVHRLRLTKPRTLKIVVRETGNKLRANHEQALRRLGANLVVYREVGFSRLLQTLQDIQGQSWEGDINPEFERALAIFVPDAIRGYRPAPDFVSLVLATLDRTRGLGIKHTFVRLHLLPHVPQTEAILQCQPMRDGDLLSADRTSLLVFLFACDEPDVEQALERIFKQPLGQLFSSQVADSSDVGIDLMLEQLQEAIHAGLPDCSLCMALPEETLAANATCSRPDLPNCELCRHPPTQPPPMLDKLDTKSARTPDNPSGRCTS